MSFIHFTLVGHFTLNPEGSVNLTVEKPISETAFESMKAEIPEELRRHVSLVDGRARFDWAPKGGSPVYDLAYKFAQSQGYAAVENNRTVGYPEELREEQLSRMKHGHGL